MPTQADTFFAVIAPATYWVIAALWTAILVLLIKRAANFFHKNDALRLLVIVLAIDAFRTTIENVYFGSLFNAYFGVFPESVLKVLERPVFLAVPKFLNIATGVLVLVLIVRRWIPLADLEREASTRRDLTDKTLHAQQLDAERDRLVRAQAVAKIGSWEANLATLEVSWSAETFRMFGVDPAHGAPAYAAFLALVHPEDRVRVDEAFQQSYDTREVCAVEHRIITPEGRVKIISQKWQTHLDKNNLPLIALGTCQDVTETRNLESKAMEAAYQLRVASDVASLGAWSYSVGSERVSWSEQTASIHDMPANFSPTVAEAIEFYAPEYRDKIRCALNACIERGERFNETLEIISARGRRVWVRAIGEAVRDRNGNITKVQGAFQDISLLTESQESLKLLEAAVSRLNDIVIITEADPVDEPGPRIVFANKAFEQHTEYSVTEVLGRSPRFMQGERTQRLELDRIRSAMEKKESIRLELINYTKSGHEYWLEIDLAPIINDAGKCTHFVAVQRDVTERKARDAQLSEINSRLETLITHAPIGFIVHHEFKPIIANKALARMLGYDSEQEIIDMESCRVLFGDEEQERITAYHEARMAGRPAPGFYSIKGKMKDGSTIDLENRAFAIQWGDRLSVCAMVTDVTDQRKVEAQLRQAQRLEAVGQMTGGVAHDFNNLLTVILGNAEFLEEGLSSNPDLHAMAVLTKQAAERGADLTGRLLAFSRQQALDPRIVDVNDLIGTTEALLRRAVGGQIESEIVPATNLWTALIDAPQFESALLNLAVNARDAMPDGGRLTIETSNVVFDDALIAGEAAIPLGQYVCIAVSDTGTGMDDETRLRVFEPFFTTKEVGKGSGLGLSMVYGLVKQSRGYIKIYSELGHGTTVKIFLPREVGDAVKVQSQISAFPLASGNEKILVVEDDDLVRAQVASQLEMLGYVVITASNGADALGILAKNPDFDLLFTDVVMPGGFSGPRLAEEALKLHPSLPVLFTSGYTENAVIHHGPMDSGINLLSKPYRRQELAAKVRAVLERSSRRKFS